MIPPITEEDHEMSDNPFMTSEELRNLFRCSSTTLWRGCGKPIQGTVSKAGNR